ncbi:DUF599 domain-containing protein [Pseudoteredinibacter isoporae]|uniref:DUF599 domain-containing protein n=1 Tax=Pseudoteredinibacter isoporae TaxID=570281 RepID=UPI0033412466
MSLRFSMEILAFIKLHDVLALMWLLGGWFAYTRFAKRKAKTTDCLASVLHRYRVDWMERLLSREQRVADAALLANIERNVSFFASTTLLVLAGLVTALAAADKVQLTLELLPFASSVSTQELELKFLILISIFIYAFFTFTWSLRQFGFVSVLLGAAPQLDDDSENPAAIRRYAKYTAKVLDQAGHSFNYGLRSYYFALASMAWFIDARLMAFSVTVVIIVLYIREFRSSSLSAMLNIDEGFEGERENVEAVSKNVNRG